jgi:hypothetical protein
VPEFGKLGSYFKADLEIVFKNLQRKFDCTYIDIYAFFEAVEVLAQKVYKDQEDNSFKDNIEAFLDAGVEYFTEFLQQQQEEKENSVPVAKPSTVRKK